MGPQAERPRFPGLIGVLNPFTFKVIGYIWASLVAQLVKNLHAMQEIPAWFLDREDPLEKR